MKKQIITLIILCITLISSFGITAVADDIKLFVDGKAVVCDVPPVIRNDRTMVPARALLEALGAKVGWNAIKRQVIASYGSKRIILVIDSNVAYVDSVVKILDSVPIILNDRTLVPARFVSESLNFDVKWDDKTRTVHINTPVKEPEKVPETENPDKISKTTIKSMVYSVSDNNFVLKFTFSAPLDSYSLYNIDNPVRTVLELKGASYSGSKTITVGSGGIKQIRTANHDDYYKIVADLDEVLKKNFVLSSDKLSATLSFTTSEKIESENIDSELPSTNENTDVDDEDEPEIIYDKYWEVTDQSVVVLDAGHGGTDVGAIGYNELGEKVVYEKDVNLAVTLETARILKENGINVMLTRSEDSSLALSQRYRFSNTNNALLFVSIHHNSHETSVPNGALTLYSNAKDTKYPNLKSSKSIAKTIQKHLVEATGLYNGGTRSEDELAVLRGTETSAVLVEVAFVSNYDDQKFILDEENLKKAAAGIAAGILEVLEE